MGLLKFIKKDAEAEKSGIHIAYGVLGSSIRIKMKEERWSGQSEYYKCLRHLTHLDTVGKVYVVGKSDLDSLSVNELKDLDPNSKIVNCWKSFPTKKYSRISAVTDDAELDNQFAYVRQLATQMLNANVKIDFGLFFTSQGVMTASALPGYLKTITRQHTRAKTLEMTMHYGSPIIDFVNRFNIPWFMFATDPRYVRAKMYPRDLSNLPKEIIGQFNEDCEWNHVKEYNDTPEIIKDVVKHTYCGIEKFNLINEKIVDYKIEKSHRFTIVSAQVDGPTVLPEKDFRFQQLKAWILDKDAEQKAVIYGPWDDNRKAGYPQFKGFIDTATLDSIFKKTKYSLVLPTKAGWATSKPWELLSMGVIPFFHSHYDMQNNMIPSDHFLRCKSPEEFYEKMDYFDAHEDERLKFLKETQETFIGDGPNGEFLTKLINKQLTKHNIGITI